MTEISITAKTIFYQSKTKALEVQSIKVRTI